MDDYLGEIRLFANTYPPKGWVYCEGQILNTKQFSILYSIIQNTYGGDAAKNTFALPDLRSKKAIGAGTKHALGSTGGNSSYIIANDNMPAHQHTLNGVSDAPKSTDPTNCFFGTFPGERAGKKVYATYTTTDGSLDAASVGFSGADNIQPVLNVQPYMDLAYAICLEGETPHRP